MRIVSWNCNGKFREKIQAIGKLNADVYVIQECENPKSLKDSTDYNAFAKNYVWQGDNKNKGLGIFAKNSVKIVENNWLNYCLRDFVSVRVNDSFNLLAVWACKPYIEEYYVYQSININRFDNTMVIIGDFNSNVIWDKKHGKRNHSAVKDQLQDIGLDSAYHIKSGEREGMETTPTFYLYRKADKKYHIDYCFLQQKKLKSCNVGFYDDWSGLSDHMPITIDII